MKIIYFLLHRVMLLMVSTIAIWFCILRFGSMQGIAIWAATMLGLGIISALLLKTSEIGKITWKNRLSGYVIPWSHALRWGRLVPIVITSWIIWILLALAVHIFTRGQPLKQNIYIPPLDFTRVLILASWVIFTWGILYQIGNIKQNFRLSSRAGQSMLTITLILCAILAASVTIMVQGAPWTALTITGLPLLAIGSIGGLYLGAIIILFRKGGHH